MPPRDDEQWAELMRRRAMEPVSELRRPPPWAQDAGPMGPRYASPPPKPAPKRATPIMSASPQVPNPRQQYQRQAPMQMPGRSAPTKMNFGSGGGGSEIVEQQGLSLAERMAMGGGAVGALSGGAAGGMLGGGAGAAMGAAMGALPGAAEDIGKAVAPKWIDTGEPGMGREAEIPFRRQKVLRALERAPWDDSLKRELEFLERQMLQQPGAQQTGIV